MAKQVGLGMAFYVGGYDLSGDTRELSKISGSQNTQDTTDITQSAVSRMGLLRDAGIDWTSYFDPTGAHVPLSALPAADVVATVFVNPLAAGSPAASMVAKQIDYGPSRAATGELTVAVSAQANGFGLEWGIQLTAGKRTDTAATTGPAYDNGAAFSNGAQAYLQVVSFSGTDATVKVQHCTTSGGTYADLIAFTQVTTAPQAQRVTAAGTVNEFFKVVTSTSGGFSSLVFAVQISVNPVSVVF